MTVGLRQIDRAMVEHVGRVAARRIWSWCSPAGGNSCIASVEPSSSWPAISSTAAAISRLQRNSCFWRQKPQGWFSQSAHYSDLRSIKGALRDQEVPVTNFAKEEKGMAVLAGDIFDVPIRRDIVHRVVVWQLAKRRQGTHSTLTISEVRGTGKKPGPQKGTGRARHGTLRGPQFRGGAIVHGPKPRDYEQGLQKKVRRLGLKVALSARLAEGKLIVFDDVVPPTPKTKDMAQSIKEMEQCKKILFVEESEKVNKTLCRATRNLYYTNVIPVKGLNVYSILQHDTLVMTLGAIRSLEQRLHTPINR